MNEPLLLVGVLVAIFVGYNIGGATTAPAFGPAVGAKVTTKIAAAVLMSVFFFLGAWTIGRRVVDTLGRDLVHTTTVFSIEASVVVLFFIGAALMIGNIFGVPSSTSMTAVGAIAGLGLATGELNWVVMSEIISWWIVAPVAAFWVSGVFGRYYYAKFNRLIAIKRSDGPFLTLDRTGWIPQVRAGPGTTRRELTGGLIVVGIGCLMAFSSGTSNIANAIAPLIGSGMIDMNLGIIIGSIAVSIGAFTIARRTLDTLGHDITNLPLPAAVIAATISAILVIALSAIGIPASFVVIATMSIIGLGWGRATRTATVADVTHGEQPEVSVGALLADEPGEDIPAIGEETPADIPAASELFDPSTTGRILLMQNLVPVISTVGSFTVFHFTPL